MSLPYDVGAGAYAIRRDERRRLRAAAAGIPPRARLEDLVDLPADELRAHVVATVAACHAFEAALEAYALV